MTMLAPTLAGVATAAFTLMLLRTRPPGRRIHLDGAGQLKRALATVGQLSPRLVAAASRADARALIDAAGLSGRLEPRDLAAARVAAGFAALLLTPRLAQAMPLRLLPLAAAAFVATAAWLPVLWLRRRAASRSSRLREALPDALDLLAASLAAGMSLRHSIALVADHCAEPVASELAAVAAETALGVPQSLALDGLAARNPETAVRALVSAIRQAERHGSPLAPVVSAQARDARLRLNREIIDRGARAGPKIQLVVSTTIVPAALLGMAAVVIAAIARGDLRFIG